MEHQVGNVELEEVEQEVVLDGEQVDVRVVEQEVVLDGEQVDVQVVEQVGVQVVELVDDTDIPGKKAVNAM